MTRRGFFAALPVVAAVVAARLHEHRWLQHPKRYLFACRCGALRQPEDWPLPRWDGSDEGSKAVRETLDRAGYVAPTRRTR